MRILVLSACFLNALAAQNVPYGWDLMNRAEAALKKYRTIQFVLDRTTESMAQGNRKKFTDRVSVAFAKPGRLWMESRGQLVNQILVSDGDTTWISDFQSKEYWKIPAVMALGTPLAGMGFPMYPGAASISWTPQTVGQEVIQFAGQKHACWVVQNSTAEFTTRGSGQIVDPVWTLWLDKNLGIDLQSTLSGGFEENEVPVHIEIKAVKRSLKLDAPIADSRFAFTPKEGSPLGFPGRLTADDILIEGNLKGNMAPPFELSPLYTLESLPWPPGKVVLLAFGTTWCQPCQRGMPVLDKLYREFKDRGFTVLQVNEGEDRATVENFLKTSPVSYQVVLATPETDRSFMVSGYPTYVVVDKDGKIVANQTGFDNASGYDEARLRSMLAQAGIGSVPSAPNSGKKKATKKALKKAG